jgi:hypothetical protein
LGAALLTCLSQMSGEQVQQQHPFQLVSAAAYSLEHTV